MDALPSLKTILTQVSLGKNQQQTTQVRTTLQMASTNQQVRASTIAPIGREA
jgi:hypothetical protein